MSHQDKPAIEVPGAQVPHPAAAKDIDPKPHVVHKEIIVPVIPDGVGALPDAKDIDPTKIKSNTLTKQGWVLPEAAQARARE